MSRQNPFRLCGIFLLGLFFVPWGGHTATDPFETMAGELSAIAQTEKVNRIAVLEFSGVNGQESIAGRVAQDRFIYAFVTQGDVVVVERNRLDTVKNELTLGMTGLLDEATTKRIGKILGVDALVYGSLTARKKSLWDLHARLVAVETGEILGATTGSIPADLLGGDSTVSPPVALQGWRVPSSHPPRVTTSSGTGSVLFENTPPLGSQPQIRKLTLIQEDKRSVSFDVEYFVPSDFEEKSLWISLELDIPGIGDKKPVSPGKHVTRLECRTTDNAHFFFATLRLAASLIEDNGQSQPKTLAQEWIPLKKIWINESNRKEFSDLRGPSSMNIQGLSPAFVSWEKEFVLSGDFGHRPHQNKKVIVGGRDMYLELRVREWGPETITVAAPETTLGPVKPYRLDPDLPYFIAVTSGKDHSNLFYFQFDPISLKKKNQ
ncbi:MAG: hypothetical protein IPN19_01070 [Elusimicrobia bacterium]|nr:hypothetical protein [Elusimicrobiota bacterium]